MESCNSRKQKALSMGLFDRFYWNGDISFHSGTAVLWIEIDKLVVLLQFPKLPNTSGRVLSVIVNVITCTPAVSKVIGPGSKERTFWEIIWNVF